MTKSTISFLLAALTVSAQAQQSGCFTAYQNQLANYEMKVSDTRYLNSIYEKICMNSAAISTDSMDVGIKAVIDSIPIGLAFGSGSTSQRAE